MSADNVRVTLMAQAMMDSDAKHGISAEAYEAFEPGVYWSAARAALEALTTLCPLCNGRGNSNYITCGVCSCALCGPLGEKA